MNMMTKKILILFLLFFIAWQPYAQNAKKYTTYVVKKGETLRKIAKKLGCRTRVIRDLNPDVARRPAANTTLVVPNKNYGKETAKEPTKEKKGQKTHIIKKDDTLFSLANKYNVTIQSIKDANTLTSNDLKIGQTIIIPSKEDFTVQPKIRKVERYLVKKGDTKYSISKNHNISISELERINPNAQGELKENVTIWVPKHDPVVEKLQEDFLKEKDSSFIYHEVKQGEGLFRIAVMYETTQKEIIALNPEATKKLRPGMLLKIPGKKKAKFLTHTVVKDDTFFSLFQSYDVNEKALISLNPELKDGLKLGMVIKIKETDSIVSNKMIDKIAPNKNLHLSFLMPLMANENANEKPKNKQLQDICTDFYMGAEIAIDSLRRQGMTISHHIYDTNNNPTSIHNLLKGGVLETSDAIIGPFFFDNAQKLAIKLSDTPIITPLFSKKQVWNTRKNLVKSAVDKKDLIEGLAEYLLDNYKQQKIIITSDNKKKNKAKGLQLGQLLKKHDSIVNLQYIYATHNSKRPQDIYMSKNKLENSIVPKKNTWVIMISDNPVVVSDIVNTYGVMANDKNIRLFTPKVLEDFDHVDYHYLAELNWTFPSVQFDDISSDTRAQFKKTYIRINHTPPSSYAYSGFDLTYDTLLRLSSNENYKLGLQAGISTRLSHQFKYIKTPSGDYRNKGILIVGFDKNMNFNVLN